MQNIQPWNLYYVFSQFRFTVSPVPITESIPTWELDVLTDKLSSEDRRGIKCIDD